MGALFTCLFTQTSLFSFQNSYTGVWEFTDTDDATYLAHIAENNTITTTYAKGENTIIPQEGYWRTNGNELHILYNNGWMDVLRSTKNGYSRTAYAPNEATDKKGGKTSVAFKTGRKSIWGSISEKDFIGYWKLQDENQKTFYLHLQEDHSARSTYSDGTNGLFGEKGIWRFEQNRVMVVYDSGWVDMITKTGSRYTKFSFAPGQRLTDTPNNTSTVTPANLEELGMKR